MAVNTLRLAGDHLMARMRARPQEEAQNIPEEHVAPQVQISLKFSEKLSAITLWLFYHLFTPFY